MKFTPPPHNLLFISDSKRFLLVQGRKGVQNAISIELFEVHCNCKVQYS